MKINIFIVEKKSKDILYNPLMEHFIKSSKQFATINIYEIFTKEIAKSHNISKELSQKSYTDSFIPFLKKGTTIALNPSSKEVDSQEFAKLLKDKLEVSFFIGGAYGFEKKFINQTNYTISFGTITLSHKLAKLVLLEQIFRALTINNNHPYHK